MPAEKVTNARLKSRGFLSRYRADPRTDVLDFGRSSIIKTFFTTSISDETPENQLLPHETKTLANEWLQTLDTQKRNSKEAVFLRTMLENSEFEKLTALFAWKPSFLELESLKWSNIVTVPYSKHVSPLKYAFIKKDEQLVLYLIEQHKKHSKPLPMFTWIEFKGILSKSILAMINTLDSELTKTFFQFLKSYYSSLNPSLEEFRTFLIWCNEVGINKFWYAKEYNTKSFFGRELLIELASPYLDPANLFIEAYHESNFNLMLLADMLGANSKKLTSDYPGTFILRHPKTAAILCVWQNSQYKTPLENWWKHGKDSTHIQVQEALKKIENLLLMHSDFYQHALITLLHKGYMPSFKYTYNKHTTISVHVTETTGYDGSMPISITLTQHPCMLSQITQQTYIAVQEEQITKCTQLITAVNYLNRWITLANMVLKIKHNHQQKQTITTAISQKIWGPSKKDLTIQAWKHKIDITIEKHPWIKDYLHNN